MSPSPGPVWRYPVDVTDCAMHSAARDLGTRFRQAVPEFVTSLLYRVLCAAVAEDEWVLGLLEGCRPGQDPPFLLFGAVHYLLLCGAEHPLRRYYPSVNTDASAPDSETAAVFSDFCRCHAAELRLLISSKLVQTNVATARSRCGMPCGRSGDDRANRCI